MTLAPTMYGPRMEVTNMPGTARRLTDVLATSPDGTLYRIERFVSDPDAYSALGTSRFDPKTHCVCRTSSGEKVAWLGGQTYQLLKSGTSLTAVDRRRA
ncbi:hypothetical protein [Achromobacter deleyi]|jgi:hypothetical protein|uniref:hypothetical protein n=1 Tax=Achromobacter deleyi TaxID=1353891 RepID=UPI001F405B23|nr:hypothetical protein [Achromobacter deleyi]UIP22758.1 hypothetical protein LYZ39_09670 [Achromobacter deleyi]